MPTGIINIPLLLHLVGCLYYLYQRCTVKQISYNETYLLIKYIKSVLWIVAKRLSCIEDARCLKVKYKNKPVNLTPPKTVNPCPRDLITQYIKSARRTWIDYGQTGWGGGVFFSSLQSPPVLLSSAYGSSTTKINVAGTWTLTLASTKCWDEVFVFACVCVCWADLTVPHIFITESSSTSDVHVTVHRDKFLIIKPTKCTNFSNLFWKETLQVSDSSSVHHQEFFYCTYSNAICHTGLLTACKQDQDGNGSILILIHYFTYPLLFLFPSFSFACSFNSENVPSTQFCCAYGL